MAQYITMAVRKIRNSWWVDFRFNRERYRKRSPYNSRAGAQAYEVVLRQKLARGEPSAEMDKKLKEQEQMFEQFAWKWFETYVKTNNKYSVVRTRKYILKTHLVSFFGKTPINKITTLHIEQYKAKKVSEGLSNKTVNNHIGILGTCLRAAQEWLELEKIPKIKKLKVPPPKTDFLSHEECKLLLSHAEGIWYEMILVALRTGLRLGEFRALDWSDINWYNRILTVRHSWCRYRKIKESPKSNRERYIPLVDEVYEILERRKKATGLIFVDEKNKPFGTKRLHRELRNVCKRAGLRKITWHVFRHTFASHLAMAGGSLKAVQELLGHVDIQTTMRYAHLAPSILRETVALLEPKQVNMNFGQPVVNIR